MRFTKIAISLADDVLAAARRPVDVGRASSLSDSVASTLAERKGYDEWAQALLDEVHAAGLPVDIPAGPLAQIRRGGQASTRSASHGRCTWSTSPSRPSNRMPRPPASRVGSEALATLSARAWCSMPADATKR